MKKIFVLALVITVGASMATIVSPNAYFSFEGSNGVYGNGSTSNPAWADKVSGVGPNYVGNSTVTWPTTTSDGIQGDAFYASDPTKSGGTVTLSYTNVVKDVFSNVQSYTVTGWVNTRDIDARGSESYILRSWGAGLSLKWRGDGRFQVLDTVDNNWRYSNWGEGYSNDEWVFFAVSRDTTSINYYFGSETDAVFAGASFTFSEIGATAESTRLIVGGSTYNGTDPYFNADMDELRIYSSADNSGALTLAQLEAIRQYDLVPEPATIALLGLGAYFIRRKRA